MEHPLISGLDDLTLDELGARVTELGQKLAIAARSGNAHLCNQIRMALESYQNKYTQKLQESYTAQFNQSQLADKIQIK